MARPKPETPPVQIHCHLPPALVARIESFAAAQSLSRNKAVERLLEIALSTEVAHVHAS